MQMFGTNEWYLADILNTREGNGLKQFFVHYVGRDKRLDEWVNEDRVDSRMLQFPRQGAATVKPWNAENVEPETLPRIPMALPRPSPFKPVARPIIIDLDESQFPSMPGPNKPRLPKHLRPLGGPDDKDSEVIPWVPKPWSPKPPSPKPWSPKPSTSTSKNQKKMGGPKQSPFAISDAVPGSSKRFQRPTPRPSGVMTPLLKKRGRPPKMPYLRLAPLRPKVKDGSGANPARPVSVPPPRLYPMSYSLWKSRGMASSRFPVPSSSKSAADEDKFVLPPPPPSPGPSNASVG